MLSADGDDGGAAAVFFSLPLFAFVFFISIHLRFISVVCSYICREKEREREENTKFDNTSEDILYIHACLYTLWTRALARTKWDGKTQESFFVFVRIKINFLFCIVLCCVRLISRETASAFNALSRTHTLARQAASEKLWNKITTKNKFIWKVSCIYVCPETRKVKWTHEECTKCVFLCVSVRLYCQFNIKLFLFITCFVIKTAKQWNSKQNNNNKCAKAVSFHLKSIEN